MTPEEFKTHVNKEKEERLVNLKLSVDKIEHINNKDISNAEAFFKKNGGISEYNMGVYLNSKGATPQEIGWLLGMNYTSEGGLNKIKIDFDSFCKERKIHTESPVELGEAIECYLDEKMNYDAFVNFTILRSALYSSLNYKGDELISIDSIKYGYKSYPDIADLTSALKEDNGTKVLSHAIRILLDNPSQDNNGFSFSSDQVDAFIKTGNSIIKVIDTIDLKDFCITKEEFVAGCNEILQAFNSKDTIKIKEMIKKNAIIFSICVGYQVNQDIINQPQKSVGINTIFSTGDYKDLNTLLDISKGGVGVCRHFSFAFKHIYNYISKEKQFDAEAINVLDSKNQHAKNIVLYLNNKGEVERKYFDPTKKIGVNPAIDIHGRYRKVIKKEVKGSNTEKKDLQYDGELRVNKENTGTSNIS